MNHLNYHWTGHDVFQNEASDYPAMRAGQVQDEPERYVEAVNDHGYTDLVPETGPASPVCCQCFSHKMPNKGQGMLCDTCIDKMDADMRCMCDEDDSL